MSQPWTHTTHSPAYPRIDEHYVEPSWCSERLFEEEEFRGSIYDPACGFGRIVTSARQAGYHAYGTDKVDRGEGMPVRDFLDCRRMHDNIVSNPPFNIFPAFAQLAVMLTHRKTALIMPTARLNAARWLQTMPLARIWMLTPRPSMPPGHVIKAGGHVGGGKSDYCWLVFAQDHAGSPEVRWLERGKL